MKRRYIEMPQLLHHMLLGLLGGSLFGMSLAVFIYCVAN